MSPGAGVVYLVVGSREQQQAVFGGTSQLSLVKARVL